MHHANVKVVDKLRGVTGRRKMRRDYPKPWLNGTTRSSEANVQTKLKELDLVASSSSEQSSISSHGRSYEPRGILDIFPTIIHEFGAFSASPIVKEACPTILFDLKTNIFENSQEFINFPTASGLSLSESDIELEYDFLPESFRQLLKSSSDEEMDTLNPKASPNTSTISFIPTSSSAYESDGDLNNPSPLYDPHRYENRETN